MALRPTPAEDSWPDEILELARQEFLGVIDIYTPGSRGTLDPVSDEYSGGTDPTPLITGRTARIQHLRLPLEGMAGGERTRRRRYRFQFEMTADDPVIIEGKSIRVTSAPHNPALLSFVFQVTDAGGSDHSPLRTVEAISEMAPIDV